MAPRGSRRAAFSSAWAKGQACGSCARSGQGQGATCGKDFFLKEERGGIFFSGLGNEWLEVGGKKTHSLFAVLESSPRSRHLAARVIPLSLHAKPASD